MSLRVRGVRKRFGGRRVLVGVDLTLDGGVLVVHGPNGCGKSTLLRIVAGVIAPDEGSVRIHDADVPSPAALRQVGYVPEAADPPEHLTVGELLALVAALRRAPCPPARDAAMGAGELADQRIGALSLGQRRRACLAAALVGEPWLLVLDEPDNGLDAAGAAELVALVGDHVARGGAALIATHDIALADALAAQRLAL